MIWEEGRGVCVCVCVCVCVAGGGDKISPSYFSLSLSLSLSLFLSFSFQFLIKLSPSLAAILLALFFLTCCCLLLPCVSWFTSCIEGGVAADESPPLPAMSSRTAGTSTELVPFSRKSSTFAFQQTEDTEGLEYDDYGALTGTIVENPNYGRGAGVVVDNVAYVSSSNTQEDSGHAQRSSFAADTSHRNAWWRENDHGDSGRQSSPALDDGVVYESFEERREETRGQGHHHMHHEPRQRYASSSYSTDEGDRPAPLYRGPSHNFNNERQLSRSSSRRLSYDLEGRPSFYGHGGDWHWDGEQKASNSQGFLSQGSHTNFYDSQPVSSYRTLTLNDSYDDDDNGSVASGFFQGSFSRDGVSYI